jgi:glycosyltransferase involved in cell wall biosynthesis
LVRKSVGDDYFRSNDFTGLAKESFTGMSKNQPKISVLMPVYNGGKYIREAIDSVLNQTFVDFELIVVNDGSTDDTQDQLNTYHDSRIRVFNQKNGGVSAALNTGLKHANARYIARFDADDVCYPNRLEKQYQFMEEHPDFVLIGSDADYMSEQGEFLFKYINIGHSNEEIQARIKDYCPFVHSSVFYRRDIIIECGSYEVNAHTFEDYFLWLKVVTKGKTLNFQEPLIKVRFNAASVTVDEKDREPLFISLKKKALATGFISNSEGQLLLQSIKRLSAVKKESSYHRMLGKKYLWNNYQPHYARKHLIKSIRLEPWKKDAYLLFALSFLPKKSIQIIYNKKK